MELLAELEAYNAGNEELDGQIAAAFVLITSAPKPTCQLEALVTNRGPLLGVHFSGWAALAR